MADRFRILLAGIASRPEQQLNKIPLLTESEKYQQLIEWNATAREYSSEKCLTEWIRHEPGSVAVTFDKETMTYGELDTRSNRLANYLRDRGVGSAGICVRIFCKERENKFYYY